MKKMNKKLIVATAILIGGVILLPIRSLATETQNDDGTTTIEKQTTATIPVGGELGAVDYTDPVTDMPEGDSRWINVTVPTKIFFWSDEATNHKTITSGSYAIKNNSGRPVQVSINDYLGNNMGIDTLQLNDNVGSNTTVDLFTTVGKLSNVSGYVIANLTSPNDNTMTGPSEVAINFTGTVNSYALTSQPIKINHTLELELKALDKNGNVVSR